MNYKASLIIPIFNEINSLETLCKKLTEAFKNTKIKYIFVDDGSSDGSLDWLNKNLDFFFNTKDIELISKKKLWKRLCFKRRYKKSRGKTYYLY